jgi:hypothetical protein
MAWWDSLSKIQDVVNKAKSFIPSQAVLSGPSQSTVDNASSAAASLAKPVGAITPSSAYLASASQAAAGASAYGSALTKEAKNPSNGPNYSNSPGFLAYVSKTGTSSDSGANKIAEQERVATYGANLGKSIGTGIATGQIGTAEPATTPPTALQTTGTIAENKALGRLEKTMNYEDPFFRNLANTLNIPLLPLLLGKR